jgi:hypothetical protein
MQHLKKSIIYLSVFAVLFTGFMGFAHTSAGRPLLKLIRPFMGRSAVCPMGYDHLASLEDRERLRKAAYTNRIGKEVVTKRNALDFVIGKTTRLDTERWATAQGGTCKRLRSAYESECDGQFFHSDSSTLWLEFDSAEHLISLRGIEKYKSPDVAISFFRQLRNKIREFSGSSMVEQGSLRTKDLEAGLMRQASVLSDFRNYSVVARVTNMGDGLAITHDFVGF